ncbi:MAG: CU044_5270 family protein [Solirubrobacteraceae bacterium]
MNAIEEIERHLRASVAARKPNSAGSPVELQGRRRGARASKATSLRTRRRSIQAAAVAVAIGGVVLSLGLVASGPAPGPSPAVAAVLERLARIAASGPSLVTGPGQYLYVDSMSDYAAFAVGGRGKACISYATDHRQIWIGSDGSGLLRETSGPSTYTSPSDRAYCLSMTPPPTSAGGTSNLWFAAQCVELGPTNDMQSLSTNPRTLLREMRRIDGGPPGPAEDFVHVGDFLRETDASPALRAALYRAAALIPGVHPLGLVRDHIGRLGLGVALVADHVRNELIFDRRTAALLGEQSTGQAAGSSSWAVYLTSRLVDRLRYPSPVTLTPPCDHGAGYGRTVPGGTVMTGRPTR